jgi:hypothetical protein
MNADRVYDRNRFDMTIWYFAKSSLIAAIALVALSWCAIAHTARAVEPREVSAAEQLGLKLSSLGSLTQTVATSPDGDELFGFEKANGSVKAGCQDRDEDGYLGFRPSGGRLKLLGRFSPLATPPVIGGGREAVVVSKPNCSTKQKSASNIADEALKHLKLLTGPLGRRPTVTTTLSATAEPYETAIAASPDGGLAVAWLVPYGHLGLGTEPIDRLYVSIGRTSGRMSPPKVFGGNHFVSNVRLAWVGKHQLLIAYAMGKQMIVQTWRRGNGFSRPQALGRANVRENIDLTIASGQAGRAAIAWGTQQATSEPNSPWTVFATVRTSENARFGATHLLDPGHPTEGPGPKAYPGGPNDVTAEIGTDGFASIAWTSEQNAMTPLAPDSVRAVVVDPSGHFQPVQDLPSNDNVLILTETPGGETLLQWEGEYEYELGQSTRQPGSDSFGPPMAWTSNAGLIDGATLIDSMTGG